MLRRDFACLVRELPRRISQDGRESAPFAKLMRSSAAALGMADISRPPAPSVFDIGRLSNSENDNQHIVIPDHIELLGIFC
jgi:hypothetical protein